MSGMTNTWRHHIDCEFWHDQYESECTCRRPGWKPTVTNSAQELRDIRNEIAELGKRIEDLEARVAGVIQ